MSFGRASWAISQARGWVGGEIISFYSISIGGDEIKRIKHSDILKVFSFFDYNNNNQVLVP